IRHDEEIPIASRLRVASGAASKEPHLFRVKLLLDALEQRPEREEIKRRRAIGRFYRLAQGACHDAAEGTTTSRGWCARSRGRTDPGKSPGGCLTLGGWRR